MQVDRLQLELHQQRVDLRKSLAETEGVMRRSREEYEEQVCSLRCSYMMFSGWSSFSVFLPLLDMWFCYVYVKSIVKFPGILSIKLNVSRVQSGNIFSTNRKFLNWRFHLVLCMWCRMSNFNFCLSFLSHVHIMNDWISAMVPFIQCKTAIGYWWNLFYTIINFFVRLKHWERHIRRIYRECWQTRPFSILAPKWLSYRTKWTLKR